MGPDDLPSLSATIREVEERRHKWEFLAGGHLEPRVRPKQHWLRWDAKRPTAIVSIDETGLTKGDDPTFPFFATAAVIIRDAHVEQVRRAISDWQERWFGSPRYVHEMDIRKGTGAFHFSGDIERRGAAHAHLVEVLRELPYTVVTVVIDKREFQRLHPDGQVDSYLPGRLYPLAVHMLFERVVHCLHEMDDSFGLVEAEGIGEKEDALLQQSYSGLRLTGTRFLSERWFRYQTRDFVEFFGKMHNKPGLQLADWVVRPCAEAVRAAGRLSNGESRTHGHATWDAVKPHLYDGGQGRPDKFGLKIYPSAPEEPRLTLWPELPVLDPVDWEPRKAQGPHS
jgi:hypothetical protein